MKTSELFASGGGGVDYPTSVPHWLRLPNNLTATLNAPLNYDSLLPFVPRADVTVDTVNWIRASASAANVYVGIYNAAGTLLSDCAVDTDTTTGLHEVSTTAVNLVAGQLYYWCLNESVAVAACDVTAGSDPEYTPHYMSFLGAPFDFSILSSMPSSTRDVLGVVRKSRTADALLSSLTMSGFEATDDIPAAGFTFA
jgi:hypothetical protein